MPRNNWKYFVPVQGSLNDFVFNKRMDKFEMRVDAGKLRRRVVQIEVEQNDKKFNILGHKSVVGKEKHVNDYK
jgi:hypothetical protein